MDYAVYCTVDSTVYCTVDLTVDSTVGSASHWNPRVEPSHWSLQWSRTLGTHTELHMDTPHGDRTAHKGASQWISAEIPHWSTVESIVEALVVQSTTHNLDHVGPCRLRKLVAPRWSITLEPQLSSTLESQLLVSAKKRYPLDTALEGDVLVQSTAESMAVPPGEFYSRVPGGLRSSPQQTLKLSPWKIWFSQKYNKNLKETISFEAKTIKT